VRSKAEVSGRLILGIEGSNSAASKDVLLLSLLCCVVKRPIRRADHSCRGVLLSVCEFNSCDL